ncbi:Membrane-associated guanylate kinase, WW and PDZ domain-containing protein 3 [Tupaia chinensis]|uniref:Membrane-associated guanylate kinase, WW and PDZ domain-containing protein 3 n=1 Tax=Tupaia chinensis TaxID=246437 RepID=L9KRD1_TUPCH|nr:Membrane-associated guanylate kinase, WW and PDZ domain-containing protein 3 [Tupaia chinensis]
MSKTLKKKKHWLSKEQEGPGSWPGPPGDFGAEIRGGAERGEFPYLGRLREEPGGGTCCVVSGKAPSPGDVLLEVNGTPVSGLTNRDTLAVIRHFREPIRLKTVKPGRAALPFCPGGMEEVLGGHPGAAACPHGLPSRVLFRPLGKDHPDRNLFFGTVVCIFWAGKKVFTMEAFGAKVTT